MASDLRLLQQAGAIVDTICMDRSWGYRDAIVDALVPLIAKAGRVDAAEASVPEMRSALAEPLARDLAREGGWQDPDAPWTENQAIIARGYAGGPVYREYMEDALSLLGREVLSSLLTDLAAARSDRDAALARATAAEAGLRKIADYPDHLVCINNFAFHELKHIAQDTLVALAATQPATTEAPASADVSTQEGQTR